MAISGHASGSAVVGVTLAMTTLAAIAVFARLFARVVVVRNAGADDGFISAALLFSIATTVTMILQVRWGMGRHISTLSLHEGIESQKAFYISIWVYNLSMSCTKFSILLQYLRIFPQVLFRKACYVTMGIVAIYSCWTFFSAVFACWPISYFWTQLADPAGGRCLNRFDVWFANAGLNIATDIAIGLLPLRVLNSLELPKRQRIALMIVFGLGGFTCVVSVLRLYSLYIISNTKDVTWENPLAAIWSNVEMNTGILCSCLPTLRSAVARMFPKLLGSFRSTANNSGQNAKQDVGGSGGSRSADGQGTAYSEQSKDVDTSHDNRSKVALDALAREMSGWGDTTRTSHIRASGGGTTPESFDMSDIYESNGRIQVTTVLEQDIEPATNAEDRDRMMRVVREMITSGNIVEPALDEDKWPSSSRRRG